MDSNQLIQAVEGKKELLPEGWKQPVSGDENSFVRCLQNARITESNIEEVKQVLRYAMIKIGLREQNWPADEEKAILIAHIYNEFGNHTPQEIQLAFDMAINYKLNLEDKEITCYENFSCQYFSKIMNAYRVWARQTFKDLKKDQPKMIEENKVLSDEEKHQWIEEWKSMPEVNIELIPLIFYDYLTEKKLIEVSTKDKWAYTEKATTQIKGQLQDAMTSSKTNEGYINYNKFCNQEKNGFEAEFKGRILNRAKRLIVYDYIKPKVTTPAP